jgi:N-acyl-L-homoserine lactone synthetase
MNYFLQINSIKLFRDIIELNLYKSLTACAMCHQLTPTDTMTNTRVGRICTRCDIQMTKAGDKMKISKATKVAKN